MKRRDLLRHMTQHGCRFVRESGEHSIWENPANQPPYLSATPS
jgi:mRNA interferase HicA